MDYSKLAEYTINLPIIGEIKLLPYAVAAVLIWLFWDQLPKPVTAILQAAWSALQKAFGTIEKKAEQAVAAKVAPSADGSIDSLQQLTVWAVNNASPDVLAKITALYADVQKQLRESK